jgi:hypothetical protein
MRNLLPFSLCWEFKEETSAVADDSFPRDPSTGTHLPLKSGENVEFFCRRWQALDMRLKISSEVSWSAWFALGSHLQQNSKGNTPKFPELVDAPTVFSVIMKDAFGVALPVGLRMARKPSGLDVTVFAEVWCINCTPLNLTFGCPERQITALLNEEGIVDSNGKELSAAEATLKEISSLFEAGERGKYLGHPENQGIEMNNEIVLIPGQSARTITEEIFEYQELLKTQLKRQWWGTESPFRLREDASSYENAFKWTDTSWVSYSILYQDAIFLKSHTLCVCLT